MLNTYVLVGLIGFILIVILLPVFIEGQFFAAFWLFFISFLKRTLCKDRIDKSENEKLS